RVQVADGANLTGIFDHQLQSRQLAGYGRRGTRVRVGVSKLRAQLDGARPVPLDAGGRVTGQPGDIAGGRQDEQPVRGGLLRGSEPIELPRIFAGAEHDHACLQVRLARQLRTVGDHRGTRRVRSTERAVAVGAGAGAAVAGAADYSIGLDLQTGRFAVIVGRRE